MTAIEQLVAYKAAAVGLWLALLFALERWRPAAAAPTDDGRFGWRRLVRNATLWLATVGLSPLVIVPISLVAAEIAPAWRDTAGWWPTGLVGLAIDIIILDLWIYWWHRANHTLQPLWRFHEVHHLDHFLDTTTAFRFHVGEVLISAAVRAVVIIALDIPLTSVLVFEVVVLCASVFHHSNVKLPPRLEKVLSKIVITPSIHWVHHHAVRSDTDSNYGTLFSFWDRIFRSASRTRRTPAMPIGVERLPEQPLLELFVRPFRLRRKRPAGTVEAR